MDILELRPLAEQLFTRVRELSFDGVGITRESYGRGESATAQLLQDLAEEHGLDVTRDRAANLIFRLAASDSDEPGVWIGSHLDSVPQGGNYDGLAGVVAGLLCLIEQKRSGRLSATPARVIGLRGEESAWFGKAYMGSGAIFGKLAPEDLELKHRSKACTLASCMESAGVDVAAVRAREKLFDPSKARAYLELHIEQGPILIARKLPVAMVPGIRGSVRHSRISCIGEAGHSGAVPRGLRHDAMFAVADLIMRLDENWRVLNERDFDLVVTTGVVSTDEAEHSISRIPGYVYFSFEARSQSSETLNGFYEFMRAECDAISKDRGVSFKFDRKFVSEPASMDERIGKLIVNACRQRGTPFGVIPSGAGHDASQFAHAGIPSGMIFIRNENGSHNPDEAMDIDDFMLGVQILADTVQNI